METLSGLFNRNLTACLHTFCCQRNILSRALGPHSPVLWYEEHRMAAAKFGVFENNTETTGYERSELGAICLKTHFSLHSICPP